MAAEVVESGAPLVALLLQLLHPAVAAVVAVAFLVLIFDCCCPRWSR